MQEFRLSAGTAMMSWTLEPKSTSQKTLYVALYPAVLVYWVLLTAGQSRARMPVVGIGAGAAPVDVVGLEGAVLEDAAGLEGVSDGDVSEPPVLVFLN